MPENEVDPELQAEADADAVDALEIAAEDSQGVTMHIPPSVALAVCRRVRALEAECDRLLLARMDGH